MDTGHGLRIMFTDRLLSQGYCTKHDDFLQDLAMEHIPNNSPRNVWLEGRDEGMQIKTTSCTSVVTVEIPRITQDPLVKTKVSNP